MLDAGYTLDYYVHMTGIHLGHFKTYYIHPGTRNRFYLIHQYLCGDCKIAGRKKMIFSAFGPNVLIIPPAVPPA